ncbi:MAG: hypothetical protein AB8B47_07875 [Roseobacter sp.]
MAQHADIVLILGSGPNAPEAADWPRDAFDRIVTINNAWRVRKDWDDLIFPEDFPEDRRPTSVLPAQRLIQADAFVPAQNAYGGFVYAGGTMAFTAGYWALHALRPRVMAFLGCDMVYPKAGHTHFYGTGTADPLRPDVTLQDLGAKSARLGLMAAQQGCVCVNLSTQDSELVFQRSTIGQLRGLPSACVDDAAINHISDREEKLGHYVPSGRYWDEADRLDAKALAEIDAAWRAAWPIAHQADYAA